MTQNEKLIIDMRNSSAADIFVLASMLVNIQSLVSHHGYKIRITKRKSTSSSQPASPAKAASKA